MFPREQTSHSATCYYKRRNMRYEMTRVQEYIARSGRYHLSQKAYPTIPEALREMKSRVRHTQSLYRTYYVNWTGGSYQENAHIESDNNTYIDVISNGGARRRFTLVARRNADPIPFGHLLRKEDTGIAVS